MISPSLTNSCSVHYRPNLLTMICVTLMVASVACAKRPHSFVAPNHSLTTSESGSILSLPSPAQRININIASAKELEALPGIGKGLAKRIVEHRAKYGPFRRAEHLIIVRGISDGRFRALRDLITVE